MLHALITTPALEGTYDPAAVADNDETEEIFLEKTVHPGMIEDVFYRVWNHTERASGKLLDFLSNIGPHGLFGNNPCGDQYNRKSVEEAYARTHTDEFVQQIQKKSSEENRRDLNRKAKELAQMEKRDQELSMLFKRIYEDHVMDRISEDQFRMLSDSYNDEQHQIQERIPTLRQEIGLLKESTANVEQFVALANKYTDPQELTPELLRTFIDKIVIHERDQKWSKKGVQQIDIYFRYIGCPVLPSTTEETPV